MTFEQRSDLLVLLKARGVNAVISSTRGIASTATDTIIDTKIIMYLFFRGLSAGNNCRLFSLIICYQVNIRSIQSSCQVIDCVPLDQICHTITLLELFLHFLSRFSKVLLLSPCNFFACLGPDSTQQY